MTTVRPALDTWQQNAIRWGHPSYVWDFGQERRLALMRRHVALDGRRILDVGCGIGTYVRALRRYSSDVYGVDVDPAKLRRAGQPGWCVVAPAEKLPYADASFDVVLLHEVIEHVDDDRGAVAEAVRVLRPGGSAVIFAPNRLYPFETHGVYLGRRYVYGLVPFVNYLPRRLRDRFCPHVGVYSRADIRRLFTELPVALRVHRCIYPGFDKVAGRSRVLAWLLRRILHTLEGTPGHIFGLSHFVVATKTGDGAGSRVAVRV